GVPAFVSTLCICIVFVPMFFLSGVAKFLFVPMAEAVVFAMIASYLLSRTLVPTLVMLMLRNPAREFPFYRMFNAQFERTRAAYATVLGALLTKRGSFATMFLSFCLLSCLRFPVRARS